MAREANPALMKFPFGKKMVELLGEGKIDVAYKAWVGAVADGGDPLGDENLRANAWQYMTRTADQYNDPGGSQH